MIPPFISYVSFNRLGLTTKNLSAILNSTEDFEMHIIDSCSKDDTWDYIMSLNDSRIKTKEHFEVNHGKTYAVNLHLMRRLPEQYFFTVDNGAHIGTKGWIGKFLDVFEAFPEVGLLGVRAADGYQPQVIPRVKGPLSYLELTDNISDAEKSYIPDHCMCLRPELIKGIGYFSEENYFGAIDLSYRVCNHTGFKAGFMPNVHLRRPDPIPCSACTYFRECKLDKAPNTCFSIYNKLNKDADFLQKNKWKFEETVRDLQSGARPVYCASLVDVSSSKDHVYNKDWAMGNIVYFIKNAN
ncbi:Glycosyl transferase family 2 [Sporobacter termitidis DSM 10068]|uniref:Glycosyl transferase family 2 n=2 Tax=Sporobacter TaxID=44748 RepID=A0A1M5U8L1_9FIRM|nr:glycosyltransferase [Sporobacter termitidis]SHH59251.1 Glycosyl transferase family 2 [Sporobacter termitidis DSM 10068]